MISNCPICGREKVYKTLQGFNVGKDKPCRSCTNSISRGGKGWTPICIDCGVNKREYHSLCLNCHNKRSKKYYKEVSRWSKYGLDGPIPMVECEICNSTEDLVIDHCHDTNIVRGVLCRFCNLGIGSLKDLKNIENAVTYLRKFNEPITKNSQ